MIGCLVRSADFERVLRTRSLASSTHFSVHHLRDRPSRPQKPVGADELSTELAPISVVPVDDLVGSAQPGLWLGVVVPKRHARRAVTRTLLKRQIRKAAEARVAALLGGLWVVRLRASFDKVQFPSAASEALKTCAREELELLLSAAALRTSTR